MRRGQKTTLLWLALAGVAVLVLPLSLALIKFRQDSIVHALRSGTKCDVSVVSFRRLLFPRPGAELTRVRFSRGMPLAEAESLRIEGSWLYLLTFQKRIVRMDAHALRVILPDPMPQSAVHGSGNGKTMIENLTAHGAVLRIHGGEFKVARLHLTDLNGDGPIRVRTTLQPPHPRNATLDVDGHVGPFGQPKGQIPLEGAFHLTGAQLAAYNGLGGTLDGKGQFDGPLGRVRVTGQASVQQFEVNRTGHRINLHAAYDAVVNGETGQVNLQKVDSHFLRTHLMTTGTVDTKLTSLDFDSQSARVDDLLTMFTHSDTPAMRAPIQLKAHVELPSGEQPFLERLRLDGTFRIDNAVWSKPRTQAKISSLSARVRGNAEAAESGDAERVFSDLSAKVRLRGGTAHLTRVSLRVPGAVATGGGTYDLQSKRVNLRGVVRMEGNASEATSGWKSVLLKPFDFLFRKEGQGSRGATLPVRVVGTYPKPRYQADF